MTDQTDWRVQLQMQIVCCTDSGCTSVMFSNTIMKITIQTLHLSWRITFFLAYHKLKIWQRNRQRWKVFSINMKAICQALIIFLILQSVKGSQGKENSKWPFTSWKKHPFFSENSESPTSCFLCRVVLDLVMQVLDSEAGQDQVYLLNWLGKRSKPPKSEIWSPPTIKVIWRFFRSLPPWNPSAMQSPLSYKLFAHPLSRPILNKSLTSFKITGEILILLATRSMPVLR